jgi:superfamily II RNA helicase
MNGETEVVETVVTNGHIQKVNDVTTTSQPADAVQTPHESEESGSEDDEESDEGDYSSSVIKEYGKLLSRRVDLVGDYAGNELFLIDGDSMLLRCFSDQRLDFDPGFQLLHAVYNVEQFLAHLVRRKCNFHIVFFDSNRLLCVPATSSSANASKYILARAVIIRHLEATLPLSHAAIQVREFTSYGSTEFDKYLKVTSPYFIMANDGARSAQRKAKHLKNEDDKQLVLSANRTALRDMILFFVESGFNVALLNGLECRDTKIMAMVLERRRRTATHSKKRGQTQPQMRTIQDNISEQLANVQGVAPGLSQRQILSVLTVAKVVQAETETFSPNTLAKLAHTFMLHQAVLAHVPLSSRRLPEQQDLSDEENFLQAVATCAESIVDTRSWCEQFESATTPCDLSDFVDGRLFYACSEHPPQLTAHMQSTYAKMFAALQSLTKISIPEATNDEVSADPLASASSTDGNASTIVMPFSNPVFDQHLAPIRLRTDERAAGQQTPSAHKIFREVTHWHNAKKPLIQRGPPTAQSEKQAFWAAKRNQQFMAEMQKYAASLTNAVGRSLEPETIIVGAVKPRNLAQPSSGTQTPDSESADESPSTSKGKPQPQKGGGGKKGKQNAGKQAMMNQIAANKAKKEESAGDKIVNAWHVVCKGIDAGTDPKTKYRKTQDYLASLPSSSRNVVSAECQLYMLSCLLQYWIAACRNEEKSKHMDMAALIWNTCRNIRMSEGLTNEIWDHTEQTATAMGLPSVSTNPLPALPSRKLSFTFPLLRTSDDVSVGFNPREFQLRYCGPYLERGFDSAPDSRVDFNPDGWQRRVLDAIDADKSVFAVAPTSAGKTFISFYAMRKVLESDDNGVLVYVAPTKALVNQIAAEIQARYSKKFKYGGKSVWAIHTRDYRINNPTGCQVLVTVPHVLQIMLLAPTNANSWSSRVKRIIFDEVHSIGQAEDGVVWEQLLLLSPCPIIALSATVGNPGEFSEWLSTTQSTIGVDLVTVQHPHRYSDLRKYYYVPPERFAFQGLPENTAFGKMGLEQGNGLNHVHPVAGLVDRSRGIPEDLALEPMDCLLLYNSLRKHASEAYPVPDNLAPQSALPVMSKKVDILTWERNLKSLLESWIEDENSPYDKVVEELERSFRDEKREDLQTTRTDATLEGVDRKVPDELLESTLPLLCRLYEQEALPGILFNYDRHECERLCQAVVEQLTAAELEQVKSGPKWEKKLERWEEWKKAQTKAAERDARAGKKKAGKKDKPEDDEKSSKLDQQMDAGAADASSWESFDPEAPVTGYHFADHAKVLLSELEIYDRQLRRRGVQPWLIDSLKRGVGVHHAGMNRKYRQVVEILFRKGFLRVVIATGTLALGINMPCKTVVFSGDSVFLTALNYRQCAGRAGRRGFDLLGNVVFHGMSREKVCRLISSRLPDLNGHFPITTTLVLRLFTLLHESKNSAYAVSAINALLSQPRMYMGGPSFKEQAMHHLRFSIEYLRRQYLLGSNGAPLNFAGLVSHLYFTENSSFAFHALLKEGYFHELCANIDNKEKDTMETLMLVMAHLFNRIPCRQADEEYKAKVVKPSSSIVFLPSMPKKAADILRRHNTQTLEVYQTYVESFVDQYITSADRKLPLTGIEVGADEGAGVIKALPATKTRSAFVALSGHGDDYDSISALCNTTREGVFLEEAVIPYVGIHPDETEMPLNAFLLDFFKHGDVHTIERANGIRRSDIWFLLNDFSLVLATLTASIASFMKLKDANDMDMLDVMGDFDAHEDATDEKAAAGEETDNQSVAGLSVADSAIAMPERPKQVSKKKTKNADSWEDVADEEDAMANVEAEYQKSGMISTDDAEAAGMWGGDGDNEGLKNVLKAFTKLHAEFNVKFRAMWA